MEKLPDAVRPQLSVALTVKDVVVPDKSAIDWLVLITPERNLIDNHVNI